MTLTLTVKMKKKRCLRLFSFDIYTDFYTICNEEQLKALFHYPGK